MSESTNQGPADEPTADKSNTEEAFSWTDDRAGSDARRGTSGSPATAILDSVRDVMDELAERAAPTVRELSARAAELTAIAADKAAPFAKRAGEATADASGKLASRSREWASELRAGAATDADGEPGGTGTTDTTAPAPTAGFEPAEGVREVPEEPRQG